MSLVSFFYKKLFIFAFVKILSNILIIFLSISLFFSPVAVFGNSGDHHEVTTEMSCCTGENHSCHQNDEDYHKKNQHNDCSDTTCPMNTCHIQTFSIELISEENPEIKTTPFHSPEKVINEHYAELILKELIYSFWHPPRYIS